MDFVAGCFHLYSQGFHQERRDLNEQVGAPLPLY